MLDALASLRTRLVVTMIATAVVGLGAATLVVGRVQAGEERSHDAVKARLTAHAIAAQAAAGATVRRFAALQSVLPNDQVTVVRAGRTVFAGPVRYGDAEVTATATFPGGYVSVVYASVDQGSTALIVAVAAVVSGVILAAVIVAALMARAVRAPIERAIEAADRVAAGDLGARMDVSAPEEFARLGSAFDGMAARLESVDRDQRTFLADVAHEIATPMNAVAGFALALADGSIATDAERADAADVIGREVARLESLVDSFRRLTRLDLVEELARDEVDVGEALADVATRLRPAARAASVEIVVGRSDARLTADRRLLDMVLDNLVSNAIRYTPAGGKVVLSATRDRERLTIAVADTGIGIAPEHQARVFDRLYRVDAARARASGGSGLGLAIAQRAARALGGRIELSSELGRGTEFRLVLPARRRRRVAQAASSAARNDAT